MHNKTLSYHCEAVREAAERCWGPDTAEEIQEACEVMEDAGYCPELWDCYEDPMCSGPDDTTTQDVIEACLETTAARCRALAPQRG